MESVATRESTRRLGPQGFFVSRPEQRSVEIAARTQTISTLEGNALTAAGDAIVTGVEGEKYAMPREELLKRYSPMHGIAPGESGRYSKRSTIVKASQLLSDQVFADKHSDNVFHGNAGDWLIEHSPDHRAVVADRIFRKTYSPVGIPVRFGVAEAVKDDVALIEEALAQLGDEFRHTTFSYDLVDPVELQLRPGQDGVWCLVDHGIPSDDAPIPRLLTLSVPQFVSSGCGSAGLLEAIRRLRQADRPSFGTAVSRVRSLLGCGPDLEAEAEGNEESPAWKVVALAEQLIELDRFNESLHQARLGDISLDSKSYITPFHSEQHRSLWEAGATADHQANAMQKHWQRSVFGTTGEVMERGAGAIFLFGRPMGLARLGLATALAFALFTEGPEVCHAAWESEMCGLSRPVLFALYLLTAVLAWHTFFGAKRRKAEVRHQDYRLMSEYLRVQYVWAVLGIEDEVVDVMPTAAHNGSGWVTSAVRSAIHHDVAEPDRTSLAERRQWARREFLRAQEQYHAERLIRRRREAVKRTRRAGRAAMLLALAAFFVLGVGAWVGMGAADHRPFEVVHHVTVIVMIVALAAWATLNKVAELYGWELEAQRGEMVLDSLRVALESLDRGTAAHEGVYQKCGRFFALDQAAWHALHRAKPIEAPAIGG